MINSKINEALQTVNLAYSDIVSIVNDVIHPITSKSDELIQELTSDVNNLSIEHIRDYILKLQLEAYGLSEIKEKSIMKAELSEAIQKDLYAKIFNQADGSMAVKGNIATMETSKEIVSTIAYTLMSSLLKNKVDQLHRMVDALKSVLMSRMQETKFMNIGTTAEIEKTTGVKYPQVTKQ